MTTLSGYFAVFNEWARISSTYEGQFREKIAPGAFTDTIKRDRDSIRVLFQHGTDPAIGMKPLAVLTSLGEDARGATYEAELLPTAYNAELMPGLEAGLYGASFRFWIIKETYVPKPKRSSENPTGLPERTVDEARVIELGPVTFGAYSGATAGVRSRRTGELQPAGRLEDVGGPLPGAGDAGESTTVRRLRREARTHTGAADLLRSVERGETVSIDWTNLAGSTRTRTDSLLLGSRLLSPRWQLGSASSSPSWRL